MVPQLFNTSNFNVKVRGPDVAYQDLLQRLTEANRG